MYFSLPAQASTCPTDMVCVFTSSSLGGEQWNFTPTSSFTTFPFTAHSAINNSSYSVVLANSSGGHEVTVASGQNLTGDPGVSRGAQTVNHNEIIV
ncbi:peptidase inhibitor family I36 protein [Streptomyces sp. NPDC086783]|uniref:peptidase inhibitor family I36 protein n=1 Tax=Streptomyces sp. NPDC086783 TaxID=3365758 RepID=UPI0038146DBB